MGGLKFFDHHKRAEKYFNMSKIELRLIKQPVDHFNETETRTWMMSYAQNMEFYQPNGPIYLLIGGEMPLYNQMDSLFDGLVNNLAKETNGALIMSEHRYYGKSLPFPELVTDNMKYLSSQQALADLATLLKYLKSTFLSEKSASPKVVVVGGSYAGNLAAWMKLVYSDLVDAGISVSGPVLATKNFFQYMEIVFKDFLQHGSPECYDKIKEILKNYETLLSTPEGIEELKRQEKICDYSDMTKKENKQQFILHKLYILAKIAQYSENIDEFKEECERMLNTSRIEFLFNEKNQPQDCYDINFYKSLKNWEPYMISWMYQTCTEFGFFQTLDYNNQPFTHNLPLEYYIEICTTLFGFDFDEKRVDKGVKATNALYGGRQPNITKVVFVNGDVDPWHSLSVLKDLSDEAPAILIPNSSHCKVLHRDTEQDSNEMREARKKVKSLIKSWIGL
ncbi:putative serine protease K12H4.7 [Hyposmocoma kahamanoa]|uniref:putative serine protease K12H4.7 n=1 Tax=Hyposmocoma kahamanoa TaxID=1477025 RepID=UPI000E6D8950|nr:putative serine protease K12H4.7 [Hyposmocoma kahamanoa]